MDWKVFSATFGVIFLAELGDKTQLAAITAVSETHKPVAVFLGASLALVVVTLLGVLFGEALTRAIPAPVLKKIAGTAFIVIGILVWVDRM